jgi:hypothetical protein
MGSPRKLFNEVQFEVGLDATQVATQTSNGGTFDRYNAANAVHDFVALIDVGTWTDGEITIHLEDSPNGSTWTDVAAEFAQAGGVASALSSGTIVVDSATDEDATQYILGYLGSARYVRVSADVSGGTTGLADIIIWYVGANPRTMIR